MSPTDGTPPPQGDDSLPQTRRLLAVMARLRDPDGGCPWDLKQDFASIAPYTIEEAYEVADAIARGDDADLREELGDLLLQVAFHARMGEEQGLFDFEQVAAGIAEKLVNRHPHVFADVHHGDDQARSMAWEAAKRSERLAKGHDDHSLLAGVTLGLPALMRAQKLQQRAARVGFDWPEVTPVYAKVAEELAELEQAVAAGDEAAVTEEAGDLLFSVVNLLRHLGVDAEAALRAGNDKFERRFRALEARVAGDATDTTAVLRACSTEELERAWEAVKAAQRPGSE